MSRRKKVTPKSNRGNSLRIIAGNWRSRKIDLIDAPGLRPTPDRVRETLFNWLQMKVHGRTCLDLFAGSGILGFEALSRGAQHVTFVENNVRVAQQLQQNATHLHANADIELIQKDALSFLETDTEILNEKKPYDLIFIDPPYRKGLLMMSIKAIQAVDCLAPDGLIYAEHESEETIDWESLGFEVVKDTKAGQVRCFLLKVSVI